MSGRFLGIVPLVFLNFGMVLETHMNLCVTELDFMGEKFFADTIWKMDQTWLENRVLNSLKNLSLIFMEFVLMKT